MRVHLFVLQDILAVLVGDWYAWL